MSLSQARTLGGIGSILVFIPFLNIVGYILLLISINDVADAAQDRSIFTNTMIAVVLEIVGVAIGLFVIFTGVATSAMTGGLSTIAGIFTGLAAIWICFVLAAYFLKKSYDAIATKLLIPQFGTAGKLFLIGAGLVIVFGIGFIVIFVAYIFQAMAFFAIPDRPAGSQQYQAFGPQTIPPTPPTATTIPVSGASQRYCPGCGSPVDATAKFCRNCGRTL